MSTQKKVLVLGAGASKPYGYPLGAELRELILQMTMGTASVTGVVDGNTDENRALMHDFQNAFMRSGLYSIDAFLGRRHEFEEVGKRCIASILLEREDPTAFAKIKNEHWYDYLLNETTAERWDDLEFSDLSIITFNYDRSLETYLLEALKHGYGKNENEVASKLESLRIVHVYGSLGETFPGGANYYKYDGSIDREKTQNAAAAIKVIPEGRMSSETLISARELLSNAKKIAFLGFGFDPTNVERLAQGGACTRQRRIDETSIVRTLIATCKGLRDNEIKYSYKSLTGVDYKKLTAGNTFRDSTCYDLLRDSLFFRN